MAPLHPPPSLAFTALPVGIGGDPAKVYRALKDPLLALLVLEGRPGWRMTGPEGLKIYSEVFSRISEGLDDCLRQHELQLRVQAEDVWGLGEQVRRTVWEFVSALRACCYEPLKFLKNVPPGYSRLDGELICTDLPAEYFSQIREHLPTVPPTVAPLLDDIRGAVCRWADRELASQTRSDARGSAGPGPGEQPPARPDGPDGATGFRYQGVEVDFGRAVRRRDLVLALWDVAAGRPRDPRKVQDVIDDVYGQNNDTTDDAFDVLCVAVRKILVTAGIPLSIRKTAGVVRMFPPPRCKTLTKF